VEPIGPVKPRDPVAPVGHSTHGNGWQDNEEQVHDPELLEVQVEVQDLELLEVQDLEVKCDESHESGPHFLFLFFDARVSKK
jgi:hypothetical protein